MLKRRNSGARLLAFSILVALTRPATAAVRLPIDDGAGGCDPSSEYSGACGTFSIGACTCACDGCRSGQTCTNRVFDTQQ